MLGIFIKALRYAADKHVLQRRKGCDKIPYINHPIKVVQILFNANENDPELLAAAILHDVLEDTCTTEAEMRKEFGERVTNIVLEVTDDMTLTYDDRKRSQIKRAPTLSADAKKIKIADKISNIRDILDLTLSWSDRRKRQYFEWSEKVISGCRNINSDLDQAFDEILKEAFAAVPNAD
jgi:GTP diphosphokinase / guanosine-3',5'-bis(diphosphate) 3'-diphosphatase